VVERPGAGHDVDGEVVWRDRAVVNVDFDCDIRVLNAGGEVIGDWTLPMGGPWAPNDDPPLTRPLEAVIDVAPGESAASTEFSCALIQPRSAEPEDDESGPRPDRRDGKDHNGNEPPLNPAPSPPEPPAGPRFVVSEGRFEGSDWGDYEGLEWRLEAWANDEWRCYRLAVGPQIQDELSGRACTLLGDSEESDLGSNGEIPADSFHGELSIAYGELSTRVDRLRIELSTGGTSTVDALIPPEESGVDARYYVAFLPPSESFHVVAIDREGRELPSGD
jgi:hypothetical protein